MELFGLDIGFSSIKAVQLRKRPEALELVSLGEIASPIPGIEGTTDAHFAEVAGAIKKLLADAKIKTKEVVVNLPENKVISRLSWFPPMKESEVRAALEFEAETFIPYPLAKVQLDYEIVDHDKEGRLLVFTVASLNETIEKYLKILKMVSLVPIALEPQSVSLARVFTNAEQPVLIFDFGFKYSILTIGKAGNVFLVRTLPFGIEAVLRAISVTLGVEIMAAEGYRRAYGLKETELEGKVRKAIYPFFEKIMAEIKKAILSFKEDWGEDTRLVTLVGGGAIMPNFAEEMVKVLGIEVQLGQPFVKVKINTPLEIDINKEGARFASAFGLASRGLI